MTTSPSPPENRESPFVAHLKKLAAKQDRAALAALRRGLGQPPGACREMDPQVMPFLPPGWGWRHQCHYIAGALFALHPESTGQGNMGDSLRRVAEKAGSDSIEQRFIALLKCHRDDLMDHLRQAVSLARSKDAPINWDQLFRDIQNWDHDDRFVQRHWAQSFWGASIAADGNENHTETTGDQQ